jgi:hypothetical protein
MDTILPGWRNILIDNMIRLRPKLLAQFDDDLDLPALERETGLRYSPDHTFYHGRYKVFRLERIGPAEQGLPESAPYVQDQ